MGNLEACIFTLVINLPICEFLKITFYFLSNTNTHSKKQNSNGVEKKNYILSLQSNFFPMKSPYTCTRI